MINQDMNEQLKSTVNTIHDIISEEGETIIDESDSDELTSLTFKNSITRDSFHTYDLSNDSFKLAAVDGGSQRILNGGSFIIGAYRAGTLIFHNQQLLTNIPPPTVKIKTISFTNRTSSRIEASPTFSNPLCSSLFFTIQASIGVFFVIVLP